MVVREMEEKGADGLWMSIGTDGCGDIRHGGGGKERRRVWGKGHYGSIWKDGEEASKVKTSRG